MLVAGLFSLFSDKIVGLNAHILTSCPQRADSNSRCHKFGEFYGGGGRQQPVGLQGNMRGNKCPIFHEATLGLGSAFIWKILRNSDYYDLSFSQHPLRF